MTEAELERIETIFMENYLNDIEERRRVVWDLIREVGKLQKENGGLRTLLANQERRVSNIICALKSLIWTLPTNREGEGR